MPSSCPQGHIAAAVFSCIAMVAIVFFLGFGAGSVAASNAHHSDAVDYDASGDDFVGSTGPPNY